MGADTAELSEDAQVLGALVRSRSGDPGARVRSLAALPGHAGFGYSFVLERSDGGAPSGRMVVRLAPKGVKIAGPADIVRQARIMESLAESDVPVPEVYWHGDETEFFGRPYLVAQFVEGAKLFEMDAPVMHLRALEAEGIRMLARLHALDWRSRVPIYGNPFPLSEELARLDHLLDRPTLDPAMTARAPALREALRRTLPTDPHIGCVHGDFQWANVLFGQNGPVALIDFELSNIGATALDIGWVSFFADPDSHHGGEDGMSGPLSIDEIADVYIGAAPFPVSRHEIRWFRAFCAYRFGVIICFNTMLHRRGKRIDAAWEVRAPNAPLIFESALRLLEAG